MSVPMSYDRNPGTRIYQKIEKTPVIGTPDMLYGVLIGVCSQVEDKTLEDVYSGVEVELDYPNRIEVDGDPDQNSVVDCPGVKVFQVNHLAESAQLQPTEFSADAENFKVMADVAPFDGFSNWMANGTDTEYEFFHPNVQSSSVTVKVNDVLQESGTDYTIMDNKVVFTTAPVAGATIQAPDYKYSGNHIRIRYKAVRRDSNVTQFLLHTNPLEMEKSLGSTGLDNQLGFAAQVLLDNNGGKPFGTIGITEHTASEHARALKLLETRDPYIICPLTDTSSISVLYKSHVKNLSDFDSDSDEYGGLFRIAFLTATMNGIVPTMEPEQKAVFIKEQGMLLGSRRCVLGFHGEEVVFTVGEEDSSTGLAVVPNYFKTVEDMGWALRLGPGASLTGLSGSRCTSVKGTDDTYSPKYLKQIAEGGVWITVDPSSANTLPYCYHALSTDRSGPESAEIMVTIAADAVDIYLRKVLLNMWRGRRFDQGFLADLTRILQGVKVKVIEEKGWIAGLDILEVKRDPYRVRRLLIRKRTRVYSPVNEIDVIGTIGYDKNE